MLSSVLASKRAVQMNIMRAFVRRREALATNEARARRIAELAATHREHAIAVLGVIKEIKEMGAPRRREFRIGFHPADEKPK